jgi:hypothetical protein
LAFSVNGITANYSRINRQRPVQQTQLHARPPNRVVFRIASVS